MTVSCQEFDRRLHLAPREWAQHLEHCEDCRLQDAIDGDLRQMFAEVPTPALSTDFDSRLRRRLGSEAARAPARWLHRLMMPAYWLAAVTASLIIVGGIDWPAGASTFGIGSVVLTLGILVVPVLFLTRQFRLSFVDLLFLSAAARPDEQLPLET